MPKTPFVPSATITNSSLSSRPNFSIQEKLNGESHLFVVTLGAVIGMVVALAFTYSMSINWFSYLLLIAIPVLASYILRKVYIHTLIHFKD